MAKKKTRRAPHASAPRMYGDGKPSQAAQQPTTAGQPASPASPARGPVAAPARGAPARAATTAPRGNLPLSEEYRYVSHDLRRLGIQAAVTFAVLLVLGLILR